LVVDDEPDLRFVLRWWLDRAGYDVSEARDGATALQAVRISRPDLVVTDLTMPGMDGLELIQRLRRDPATAGIPIVVVSTNWETATDMDAALSKPCTEDELLAVAGALIKDGRDAL
jgi:CheY-like chemotaxis protein